MCKYPRSSQIMQLALLHAFTYALVTIGHVWEGKVFKLQHSVSLMGVCMAALANFMQLIRCRDSRMAEQGNKVGMIASIKQLTIQPHCIHNDSKLIITHNACVMKAYIKLPISVERDASFAEYHPAEQILESPAVCLKLCQ